MADPGLIAFRPKIAGTPYASRRPRVPTQRSYSGRLSGWSQPVPSFSRPPSDSISFSGAARRCPRCGERSGGSRKTLISPTTFAVLPGIWSAVQVTRHHRQRGAKKSVERGRSGRVSPNASATRQPAREGKAGPRRLLGAGARGVGAAVGSLGCIVMTARHCTARDQGRLWGGLDRRAAHPRIGRLRCREVPSRPRVPGSAAERHAGGAHGLGEGGRHPR